MSKLLLSPWGRNGFDGD